MPEPFKEGLNRAAVERIAANVRRAWPAFPSGPFVREASEGLSSLELKDRVRHVTRALRRHLPAGYLEALAIVVRAGEGWDAGDPSNPLRGIAAWPLVELIGEYGLDDFDRSMEALRTLTEVFSGEFAVRPFLARDPARALRIVRTWVKDRSEHVRRLASEGTRPRLPWGMRLSRFQQDPQPVLALLEELKDDPSEYVRRSVSNNLNDIAKDHPDTVIETCRRWGLDASKERRWIIERATRTLVKQGHAGALDLLGFQSAPQVAASRLTVTPKEVAVGEVLEFAFSLRSTSKRAQPVVVDYAIHHVKKNGERTPKVFKLQKLTVPASGEVAVRKRHSFKEVTVRRYYPGRHVLEVLVNGKAVAKASFELAEARVPERSRRRAQVRSG